LPVPAYNTFSEKIDTLSSLENAATEPALISIFDPADFDPNAWPVQPGDYELYQLGAPIAIALLGGLSGVDTASFSLLDGVAIVGTVTTENLGIEHILKNLVSNPFIRHLILFGEEISGHRPGDALVNLKENGIEENQRIKGARGARPILKNTLPAEAEHFRKQVEIHSLIGQKNLQSLKTIVASILLTSQRPYKSGLRAQLVEVTEAKSATKLRLDPRGYFVVMIQKGKNPLYVEHYSNDGRLKHIVEGKDAATVCSTIVEMGLVSQLDHAAYVGRELAKAQLSLSTQIKYVQDKAQGELECGQENNLSGIRE